MEIKYKAVLASFLLLCFAHQYSTIFRTLVNFLGILTILAVFAWELGPILASFFIKPFASKVNPKGKAVLVTGCDSGFGHGAALLLNKMGFKVFAGCLFPNGPGAESLKSKAEKPDQLIVVKMDVTKDEDLDAAYETINSTLSQKNSNEKLWGLVNNAGILRMAPIECGDFNYFVKDQFDVNVFAVVKVTRKFSPLIRQSKGRVVILSSIASRVSLPPLAAYCMSKHCITAFGDCLREEIADAGVKVTTIEPYFYGTDMLRTVNLNEHDDKCWSTTDASIKKVFSQSSYKKMIADFFTLIQLNALGANQDPGEVSRTVAKALTDPEPLYRYICASPYIKPLLLLGQLVPREIFIWFYQKIFEVANNQLEKSKAH
ncbi:D-beta-hydroxybutyrate dehydrogenase, mitochondrial [Tetranychus urticae]|uniref:Uncharacterized protein n=1 Tax=Tetranychus urticae TaxID=32264 RepID=T1KBB8_TETUR|nr:D-beta-hydroxybutyrate dehydrogenase, mitochondrial [Tetranychus urticae]XP_015785401.1 D-beta-hydroxybutyrate dehydrogenase, mitochondrial [Tetranychus urticae]XP_015785402.1 D-beta-hydroxybutyrate dehydrogenase, mitochondrial [Tetranychus urticae]